MKKIHLVAMIMIGIAIAMLTMAAEDMSTYANFKEASNSGETVKVVGQLSLDKEIYYEPTKDPNYFSFFMTDITGETRKVVLKDEKPQDFEHSEQVVVTGSMEEDTFMARSILLKCPSKYKDEEIYLQAQ